MIRASARPAARLVIDQNDSDDAPFVLVRGRIPHFEVVGWLFGHEAKRREWLETYGHNRPAYFVPVDKLRALDALP